MKILAREKYAKLRIVWVALRNELRREERRGHVPESVSPLVDDMVAVWGDAVNHGGPSIPTTGSKRARRVEIDGYEMLVLREGRSKFVAQAIRDRLAKIDVKDGVYARSERLALQDALHALEGPQEVW